MTEEKLEPIDLMSLADAFAGIQALLARLVEEVAWLDKGGQGKGEDASPLESFVATNYGGRTVMVQRSLTPEREQGWRNTEHTALWTLYWREPSASATEERAWYVSLDKGADGPPHLWVRRVYFDRADSGRAAGGGRTKIADWMIEVSEAVGSPNPTQGEEL